MKKTKSPTENADILCLRKFLKTMKLTCLLLTIPLIHILAGKSYSQSTLLNLSMRDASVKEVLVEIENQSEFIFMYSGKLIDVDREVSLDIRNKSLDQVLNKLFSGTDVTYAIKDNIIVLTTGDLLGKELVSGAQQKKVSGTVTDLKGEPLIGVNVVVKGTTTGTVTGIDGNYTLEIPESATLLFSAIGMKSYEVMVGDQTVIDVSLEEDIVGLEEIVVVGYGTLKKRDLTGAVARADMKILENTTPVNVLQGLKGVVPGLNIGTITKAGDNPTISIRGRNSISGTESPLIVLDGIIYRGAFTDINPSDIESIDVLKDASSAAIYGSQAANGVLLISTKSTLQMSKPIIEYNGSYAMQSLINNDLQRLDRQGFIDQLHNTYLRESRLEDDLTQPNPEFDLTQYFRDESVSAGYADGTDIDWWNLLSEPNPYIQNHNLSLRGKNELTGYFVSFGYTDQKNMVLNDTYKRVNLRINLDAKVTDWLKVGTQSFFANSDLSGRNPGFASLCYIPALVNPYEEDGTLREQIYLGLTNPLLLINNPDEEKRNTLSGLFYTEITVPWIKGLSYRLNYSNNLISYKKYEFDPYWNSGAGSGSKYLTNQNEWTLDNIISYQKEIGIHDINATLVYGVEDREYEDTRASGYYYSDQTLIHNQLESGQADQNVINSEAWEESSLYTMARGVYTLKDRYIVTGTIRRDGYSSFGSNTKFGVFPSAAIAWRISEENFMKNNLLWLDNLKLRLSYGKAGNIALDRYSTQAKMSLNLVSEIAGGYLYGDGGTGGLTQAVQTMANDDLRWETTTSTNLGLDFSILKSRLFGNYEFYRSKTTDLIYNISIPVMNGTFVTEVATNIGELKNHGHEFSITGIPLRTKDFEWIITGNFSINKNEVVTILGYDLDEDGREDDLVSSGIFIGEPLGTIYDYELIGMWQMEDYYADSIPSGFTFGTYRVADLDTSGNITAANDRKIIGYEDPLFRFSINTSFAYKGFEFRASIYSVQGGKNHYLGQPASRLLIPDHLTNYSFFEFDYWTPENPDAKYRQLGFYNPSLTSAFSPYVSRSFVRLQEISLGYNFSSGLLKKVKIQRAKIWISGTNLLTLTKWDGWDPESNQGLTYDLQTPTDDEDEFTAYPTMKSYNIGVNLAF